MCVKFVSACNFGTPRGLFTHYMDYYLQMSKGTEIKQVIDSSSPFLTVMFQKPVVSIF